MSALTHLCAVLEDPNAAHSLPGLCNSFLPENIWTGARRDRYRAAMSIVATIMNSGTEQAIQKMTFGRMPKPGAVFNLETGESVTADRVHVRKPAPGKFVAPVEV